MKDWIKLVISVLFCELVGLLGVPFTVNAIPTWYAGLNMPFFSPPNWLFSPVWTTLYFMMGVSLFLVWKQGLSNSRVNKAVKLFLLQLFVNFIWTPIFFGLKSPWLALVVILVLCYLIVVTIRKFYPISKWAAYLLVPYLIWVSFATILNASIAILN